MSTLTLVLLPGMDGTGELFAPFVAELGAGFDVKVVRFPDDSAAGYIALEELARRGAAARGSGGPSRRVLLGADRDSPGF